MEKPPEHAEGSGAGALHLQCGDVIIAARILTDASWLAVSSTREFCFA